MARQAWGDGIGTFQGEQSFEVWFARPRLGDATDEAPATPSVDRTDSLRGVQVRSTRVVIADLDEPPGSVEDAYLRLHLLSHRLVRPNEINLDGLFGVLPNICWTSIGPVAVEDLEDLQRRSRIEGFMVEVRSVDKFPRMLDYVAPSGGARGRWEPGPPWSPLGRRHDCHA